MAEQDEVVYEEVVLEELKSKETELKDNQKTGSRNIKIGGADAERTNHPCGLLLIIVGVILSVAVSSAAITAIVLTMNFDSRLREMALNISLKHGEMAQDITSNMQHNDDAITSLREESMQQHKKLVRLNTTLLKHGAQFSLLNDSIEDVKESVKKLIDNSHRYKDLISNVQQNEDAITSLREESEQQLKALERLNITLMKHGAKLSLLNDSLEDVNASVEKLIDNSRRYKVCLHGGKNAEDGLCECPKPYNGSQCETVYTDCYDIHQHTDKPTGIYTVIPRGSDKTIEVKCDMDINGGGWTVFQYRHDGSVDFYKKLDAYEHGFGSVTGEFWLGLEYIHAMTSSVPSVLRIDVAAADGTTAYQTYDDFNISEGPDYRLNIGATSGIIGDDGSYRSLSYNKGWPFITYDHDRDVFGVNCAKLIHGAWWYSSVCSAVNLNGEYPTPGTTSTIYHGWGGMIYYHFKKKESLKSSKIMFRRN